ncbi:hypothetical protein TSAR_013488 [Trichomalopsis sarcophagae]|uniref:Uncharacterized protein n=1 Tax=Trichomalopsis sarcophagae TaxID=543379 RepID=A0A232FI86_9HYME|nr:hypothetical protein TSAR_013488 [Trichomalopsis sarcophagae]
MDPQRSLKVLFSEIGRRAEREDKEKILQATTKRKYKSPRRAKRKKTRSPTAGPHIYNMHTHTSAVEPGLFMKNLRAQGEREFFEKQQKKKKPQPSFVGLEKQLLPLCKLGGERCHR